MSQTYSFFKHTPSDIITIAKKAKELNDFSFKVDAKKNIKY
ncbi:MAG: hypothetical protein Q9M43_06340 [Sulfurimonas sp.]|nr:hypothetical protein [Sulfurimonas sp.]